MADLGFGTRAEMIRWIRLNLVPDTAVIGRNTVRQGNLYLPTVKTSISYSVLSNAVTAVTPFTLSKQNAYNNGQVLFDKAAPDRVTIHLAGWYRYSLSWDWAVNAAGQREVWTSINGATYDHDAKPPAANGASGGTLTNLYYFAANDYVGMVAFQNSGGALVVGADLCVEFVSN